MTIIQITNDGKLQMPNSNLEICFIDTEKAMNDMKILGDKYKDKMITKDFNLYDVLSEFILMNKSNIKEFGFTNINDYYNAGPIEQDEDPEDEEEDFDD